MDESKLINADLLSPYSILAIFVHSCIGELLKFHKLCQCCNALSAEIASCAPSSKAIVLLGITNYHLIISIFADKEQPSGGIKAYERYENFA